jgi:hypothetical protein
MQQTRLPPMGKRTIRKTSNLAAVQHQLGHRNVSYTLGVSANVSSFVATVPTARRLHNADHFHRLYSTVELGEQPRENEGGPEGPP